MRAVTALLLLTACSSRFAFDEGHWVILTQDVIQDSCELSVNDVGEHFVVESTDDHTFLLEPMIDDAVAQLECLLDSQEFSCAPAEIGVPLSTLGWEADWRVDWSIAGSAVSEIEMSSTAVVAHSCTGADCDVVADLYGMAFPCQVDSQISARHLDTLEAPPNSPPVAKDDQAALWPGDEVKIDVLDNDSDPDDDNLEIIDVGDGDHGTTRISGSGRAVFYTSDPDFTGSDTFEYTIADAAKTTATATVTIDITELPTLIILSPTADELISGEVTVEFAVTGCNFTTPSSDSDGCHAHQWLDGSSLDPAGHYSLDPIELGTLPAGVHEFDLALAVNDGSDQLFDPRIEDTVRFEVQP